MNITRHNYEEFFILYMDNELSREDRGRVEIFVQQNPDLGEELEMLQQTKLDADSSIVYKGKQDLIRSAAATELSLDNYQEWLLLYIDDELSIEQEIAVENFAIANPSVKAELDVLQKTKLQPEENVFYFNKDSLYRTEETSRRVIAVRWWRIAAAAVLLFAVSIASLYIFTRKSGVVQPGLAETSEVKPVIKKEPIKVPLSKEQEQPGLAKNTTENKSDENITKQPATQETKNTNIAQVRTTKNVEQPTIVENPIVDTDKNNIPNKNYDPIISGDEFVVNTPNLKDINNITSPSTVTNLNDPALNFARNSLQPDTDAFDETSESSAKKTRFRGLLRKITRTIEKTTNIKATDDEDRLLVGNLAIRL